MVWYNLILFFAISVGFQWLLDPINQFANKFEGYRLKDTNLVKLVLLNSTFMKKYLRTFRSKTIVIMAANLAEKIEAWGLQCDLMLDLSGNIDLLVSTSNRISKIA